jgi:hypothetical protein
MFTVMVKVDPFAWCMPFRTDALNVTPADHLTIMKPTDGEPVLGLNERDFKAHLADLEVSPHPSYRIPSVSAKQLAASPPQFIR